MDLKWILVHYTASDDVINLGMESLEMLFSFHPYRCPWHVRECAEWRETIVATPSLDQHPHTRFLHTKSSYYVLNSTLPSVFPCGRARESPLKWGLFLILGDLCESIFFLNIFHVDGSMTNHGNYRHVLAFLVRVICLLGEWSQIIIKIWSRTKIVVNDNDND